ncbi:MAG: integrase core domain-containing protein, partial [Crocinitomix sp.]|nr:integrase core domain-containing protein [Crocinitomix sp.]
SKQHTVKKVWEAVIENHLQPNDMLKKGISIEVRNDNDPRFSAKMVQEFFLKNHLNQVFTQPYTPQENGHIESFHAILGRSLEPKYFHNLEQLDVHLALFYMKYNEVRLHGSLAGLSPKTFWQKWELGNIKRIVKPKKKIQFKLLIPYHQISGNVDLMEASCLDYLPSNSTENPFKENGAVTLNQLSVQSEPSVASC